jgi:hypothetical protein
MQKKGAKIVGMNYLTNELTLGECIRSLKFGLTSYISKKYTSKGTAK